MFSSYSKALVIIGRGRTKYKKFKNFETQTRSRGRSKLRSSIKCYHYENSGHMKKECNNFKREKANGKSENKNDVKNTIVVASIGEVVVVYDDGYINVTYENFAWEVDFATSCHVTF